MMRLSFRLNGKDVESDIDASSFLVDVVRGLGLTGTKEGCGVGVCGLCTVLVNDQPVSSCLYFAACVDGADVWTVEGMSSRFPEVVASLVAAEGMQCGICTPGQVVALCALSLNEPDAEREDIKHYLNGNLCRCTGYQTILAAALEVVSRG